MVSSSSSVASSSSSSKYTNSRRNEMMQHQNLLSSLSSIIAGAISGAAGTIVGHPLDTLKVRLQLSLSTNSQELKSLSSAVVPGNKTTNTFTFMNPQYIRSLYRGVLPPLCTSGIMNSINFGIFENNRILLESLGYTKNSKSNIFLSSAGAGAVISIITSPISLVKIQRQKNAGLHDQPKGYVNMIKDIYHESGFKSFYRGWSLMFCMESFGRGAYMVMYYTFKPLLKESFNKFGLDIHQESISIRMLAASTAGVVSWLMVYPLDVIKSQLQADVSGKKYKGLYDCAKQTYHTGGPKAFLRGISYTIFRAAPTAATVLPAYEVTKDYLDRTWKC